MDTFEEAAGSIALITLSSDPAAYLPVEIVLYKSNWEETLWQTQNTLEGLYIPTGLRISPEELEDVTERRDALAILLRAAGTMTWIHII